MFVHDFTQPKVLKPIVSFIMDFVAYFFTENLKLRSSIVSCFNNRSVTTLTVALTVNSRPHPT